MKKITLLASLALAFSSLTANAFDKEFQTVDLSKSSSFTAHGDITVTPGTSSATLNTGSCSGGRSYYTAWDESIYNTVTLPASGYTATTTFSVTAAGDEAKNDFEIALLPAGVANNTNKIYAGTTDYLFCLTQVYSAKATAPDGGTVLGTGHIACGVNVAKASDAANPTLDEVAAANVDIVVGTKYTLKVNVVNETDGGVAVTKAYWSITSEDQSQSYSDSYTVQTTNTNICSLQGRLTRTTQKIQFDKIALTHYTDKQMGQAPTCKLIKIVQNTERYYDVAFHEGEKLHWMLPGGDDEADGSPVAYEDAMSELYGTEGVQTLDISSEGTIKMWTTVGDDEDTKSTVVEQEVKLEWNKCPTPTLTITKVDNGFGKSYRISVSNTSMEMAKDLLLYYTITDDEGVTGDETAINSGETFDMPTEGSIKLKCTTAPEEYGGQEMVMDQPAETTIENKVEYETVNLAQYYGRDANFNKWTTDYVEGTGLFNERNTSFGIGADTGSGHWANSFASENAYCDYNSYNKRSTNLVSAGDYSAILAQSVWCYDAKDQASAQKAFLPLVPLYTDCTADMSTYGGWAFLLDEGAVVDEITQKNAKGFSIDPMWLSDDEANKPNLAEIVYTTAYDKYNSQFPYDSENNTFVNNEGKETTGIASCHHKAFVTTAAPALTANPSTSVTSITNDGMNIFRYDTSINEVKIHIYKGFVPGSSINGVTANDNAVAAPAVKKIMTANGFQIVKDGKKFNAAGAQLQ